MEYPTGTRREDEMSKCLRARNAILILLLFLPGFCLAEDPLPIGALCPLTGDGALYGKREVAAIQLAFDEANAAGAIFDGRKLEARIEDSRIEPAPALFAAQKLIDVDNVPAIIGPTTSGATLAVAPVVENRRIVLISPIASADKVSGAGDFVFRIAPKDQLQAREAVRWFHEKGFGKAAILYINNEYGVGLEKSFREDFERQGGKVIVSEAITPGQKDFRAEILKVKASGADALWLPIYMSEGGLLVRQKADLKFDVPVLGTDPVADPLFLEAAGPAAEGIAFTNVTGPAGPTFQAFAAKYRDRSGMDAEVVAAQTYDAARALIEALKIARSMSPVQIKDALYKVSFQGASGQVQFDKNGDNTGGSFSRFIYRGGKIEDQS